MIKWEEKKIIFLPFIHECVCENDIFNCSWFLLIGLGAIFEYRFDIAIIVNGLIFNFFSPTPFWKKILLHSAILKWYMLVLNIIFIFLVYFSLFSSAYSFNVYQLNFVTVVVLFSFLCFFCVCCAMCGIDKNIIYTSEMHSENKLSVFLKLSACVQLFNVCSRLYTGMKFLYLYLVETFAI